MKLNHGGKIHGFLRWTQSVSRRYWSNLTRAIILKLVLEFDQICSPRYRRPWLTHTGNLYHPTRAR